MKVRLTFADNKDVVFCQVKNFNSHKELSQYILAMQNDTFKLPLGFSKMPHPKRLRKITKSETKYKWLKSELMPKT